LIGLADGRDGKGAVVLVAAGNGNTTHDFPSNLEDVLSVSASNEFDEPKTPSSRDGETWWGSNFGPKIDVAAPGVHNATTDNAGNKGYNQSPGIDGNYVDNFNGTSSSTPIGFEEVKQEENSLELSPEISSGRSVKKSSSKLLAPISSS